MATKKRGNPYGTAAKRARVEARRAAAEIAASAEARQALARAAWRTGSSHTRALADSREVRALQTSVRRAAQTATTATRAATVAATVATVTFVSARMGHLGSGNTVWLPVATLLFAIVPPAANPSGMLAAQSDRWD